MTALRMFYFWLTGQNRRLGGLRAARSRRLNAEAAKKFGAVVVSGNGVPASLSVLESVADQKSGGAA